MRSRLLGQEFRLLAVAVVAGRQRHAGLFHQRLGGGLRAHGADGGGRRPDEDHAGALARLGEILVLGKEAVAGMDRLRAGLLRHFENAFADQVGSARFRAADQHGLVGQAHVAGIGVGLGIHRHGGDAHAARGLDDAAGDFTAVCNQYFRKHARFPQFLIQAGLRFSRNAVRPSFASGVARS